MPDDPHSALPRIEDFRSDLDAVAVRAAQCRHARALACTGYLYAFPAFLHLRQLSDYLQGRAYLAPGTPRLGGWVAMRDPATPATRTVSPNVDTLYAAAYVLLDEQGPVVLEVPAIADRYFSVALMDAFFDHFAIVGPRTTGTAGGRWLIVPAGWDGVAPDGFAGVLESPSNSVCIIQRVYLRGADDLDETRRLQDAIRLRPLDGDAFAEYDLTRYEVPQMGETRDPLRYFELVNAFLGEQPVRQEDAMLVRSLDEAGVGPGSAVPTDPDLRSAIAAGAADAQAAINARITAGALRNGWKVPDMGAGVAGQAVLARAVTQMTAMEAFPAAEAIYYFAYRDGDDRSLDGTSTYTLAFPAGGLPPLHEPGFWSITLYGADSLLTENPIDRYLIRPDTPGLTFEPDGTLRIWISHARPDGAPDGNWLPAPAAPFNVALRAYLPTDALIDGTWFPPPIVRTEAP